MALMRRVFPGLETAHLLFLGNINPDLEYNHAGFREAGLVVVDFGISPGPFGVGGKALDPFHHYAPIPGAVENREVPWGGRLIPEAPQVVAGFFFGGRRGYRVDLIVRYIHQPAETANRTALARGIGALEGEDGAQALGGGEAGESTETGLQLGDLSGVVFSVQRGVGGDAFEEAARASARLLVLHCRAATRGQGKLADDL